MKSTPRRPSDIESDDPEDFESPKRASRDHTAQKRPRDEDEAPKKRRASVEEPAPKRRKSADEAPVGKRRAKVADASKKGRSEGKVSDRTVRSTSRVSNSGAGLKRSPPASKAQGRRDSRDKTRDVSQARRDRAQGRR